MEQGSHGAHRLVGLRVRHVQSNFMSSLCSVPKLLLRASAPLRGRRKGKEKKRERERKNSVQGHFGTYTTLSLSISIRNNKIMGGVSSSLLPLFYSVHEQIHDLQVSHSNGRNLSVSCSKFCLYDFIKVFFKTNLYM